MAANTVPILERYHWTIPALAKVLGVSEPQLRKKIHENNDEGFEVEQGVWLPAHRNVNGDVVFRRFEVARLLSGDNSEVVR